MTQAILAQFDKLSWHLPETDEEMQVYPESGKEVFRYEPGISRIQQASSFTAEANFPGPNDESDLEYPYYERD